MNRIQALLVKVSRWVIAATLALSALTPGIIQGQAPTPASAAAGAASQAGAPEAQPSAAPPGCVSRTVMVENPQNAESSFEAFFCESAEDGRGDLYFHSKSRIAHILHFSGGNGIPWGAFVLEGIPYGRDKWFRIAANLKLEPNQWVTVHATRSGVTDQEHLAAYSTHIMLIGNLQIFGSVPDPTQTVYEQVGAMAYNTIDYLPVASPPGKAAFDCNEKLESGAWYAVGSCMYDMAGDEARRDVIQNVSLAAGRDLSTEQVSLLGRWMDVTKKQIENYLEIIPYLAELSDANQDGAINIRRTGSGGSDASTCLNCPDGASILSASPASGAVLRAGQGFEQTWLVRNSGTGAWSSGYRLKFYSGDGMGGPTSVIVPALQPGAQGTIRVSLTASTSEGAHTGYWKLMNGATYFGPLFTSSITVKTSADPVAPGEGQDWDVSVTGIDYPSVVAPGTVIRPKITVKVNQGELLANRDMLRNTDGQLYGAHPHVSVERTTRAGQSYTFEFYANDPITAPGGEGTYITHWRVWRNSNWAGPEITLRFDVRNGGGARPNPPALSDPANWFVANDGSTPALCASSGGSVQYFFQVFESNDVPESGWTSSNCWTPPGLGFHTYKWHVKVRDTATGLESDWSERREFTIKSYYPTITDIRFDPPSPSAATTVRFFACADSEYELRVNTANDGSDSGSWVYFGGGAGTCNPSDASQWRNWFTLPFEDGTHALRLLYFKNGETGVYKTSYTLNRRQPTGPIPIGPTDGSWVNSLSVPISWKPSSRALSQRLVIDDNEGYSSPLFDLANQPADFASYTAVFDQPYPTIFWAISATNELGTQGSGRMFHIDIIAPASQVTALPDAEDEPAFVVQWAGSDDRSGIRFYNVQVMDITRPDGSWEPWMTSTSAVSSIFHGQPGHRYAFRSQALDVAGNLEAWPAGPDTVTEIDPAAKPPTPWWNAAYGYRRSLVILNNDSAALAAQYPVRLHFDGATTPTAAELYAASQSAVKGDDFRIVLNHTTELPRFVQSFDASAIDIWFPLASALGPAPASDSSAYVLYYGNAAAASPPGDVNLVLPPPVDGSTVGLWHMNEASGSALYDSSGHGNHGALTNGSRAAQGKFGPAAAFNGSSTYAEIPSSNLYNLNAFTIEGWFRFWNRGTQMLLRRRMSNNQDEAYRLEIRDFKFWGNIGGARAAGGNTTLVQGRWYHLAFTYDGATLRTYINGVLDASVSYGTAVPASSGPLVLGRNNVNADPMDSQVQGLRISNQAQPGFPYGAFGLVTSEPSTAAGSQAAPPATGGPDLALLDLSAFSNPEGGVLVRATVQNVGTKSTLSGFYTDLYLNHLPTGSGDYTGALQFWVNDPIDPGQSAVLTAILTAADAGSLVSNPTGGLAADAQAAGIQLTTAATAASAAPGADQAVTLYAQTDTTGSVQEVDKTNNRTVDGEQACFTTPDAYESDGSAATAKAITTQAAQVHNTHQAGDVDWIRLNATAGQVYYPRTFGLGPNADTVIEVYAADGVTLLASNDDAGNRPDSFLEWTAPSTGIYYFRITQWNPHQSGCGTQYSFSLSEYPVKVLLPAVRR